MGQTVRKKSQPLEEGLPQFEIFLESRERYVRALEKTIKALTLQKTHATRGTPAVQESTDTLAAIQELSAAVVAASDPETLIGMLTELTRQVIPVTESDIFLLQNDSSTIHPLSSKSGSALFQEAEQQLASGVVDWAIAENKTIVIPDLRRLSRQTGATAYIVVPLVSRGRGIGIYLIHTERPQEEVSAHDVTLLSVLANQAAVGLEHWRTCQELNRVNAELKFSQAQMVQAAKLAAIGELAAGIAHEIKNPLQVLMLHLELYQAGRPVPNWVEMFSKQVKRLSDLTLRLMNFARSASEEVSMAPVKVNQVIDDIVAMVEHEWETSGIHFEKSYEENLPPVLGNANYLQQVFLNLLINARDAMNDGGAISINTSLTGFFVSVRLSDTGPGIDREIQQRIFQPFFTTKGEKGTGLGLAICSKIVAQHKGEIRIESEPGKGTTFTVFLPIWRGGGEGRGNSARLASGDGVGWTDPRHRDAQPRERPGC